MLCKRLLIIALISVSTNNLFSQTNCQDVFSTTKRVADWQMLELQTKKWKYPATDWTNGAYYTGMMAWSSIANNDKYILFLKAIGDSLNWQGGPERFFADDYCVGQTWAQLYMLYKDSSMIKPMMGIADDIIKHPHSESLQWNFDGGLHNREWAWCDALYMGPPMLAYLSTATGQKKYLDIADKLWWRSTKFLYDSSEQLYFRDSRYFDKKEKNGKKVFWSRGNGWVIAGITRILDNMPADYSSRKGYEKIFKQMAKRIAALQQPDGTWHASLLDPASYPIKETSGTAFFAYALTWGINKGYLPYNEYFPVVIKAWDALKDCIHENGKLGFVQVPGASPDKVTFDDTEVYGVGAFLLAGTELFKLLYEKEKNCSKIVIQNTTAINRQNEIAEINWLKLVKSGFNEKNIVIINAQTGSEVPSQVLFKGKKTPQSIILQSGTSAGSSAFYFFKKQTAQNYQPKTYGRIVPERMDDFAWENDCIAFRMYGPALEKNGEISNGIDIWVKRTKELIINKWYKEDDYHKDHGEGLDFYGVGKTLGAGGIAPIANNKIYPSKNFVTYKVLDNGPLRTSFQLSYASWSASGIKVTEIKNISLDAGSFLNRIEVTYRFSGKQIPVAVGIAKLPGEGLQWNQTGKTGFLAYQQPAQTDGTITIGVLIPQASTASEIKMTEEDHYNHTGHYLLKAVAGNETPFIYYQGANWDKEGSFTSFDDWKEYLKNKLTQIKNPLKITIK